MNQQRSWLPGTLGPRVTAVTVAAALLVVTLVAQTVLQAGVVVAGRGIGVELASPSVVVALLVVGQVTFLSVGTAYSRRRLGGIPFDGLSRRAAAWVVGGLAVKFTLFGLSRLVTDWLGVQDPPDLLTQAVTAAPWLLLVVAALSMILVGPAEEVFFRGAVQGRLRRAFGPVAAVLLAAVLFAVPHSLNYVIGGANPLAPGAVVSVTTILATGAVMGFAYERTGNILVPVLLHGGYNAGVFLAFYAGLISL